MLTESCFSSLRCPEPFKTSFFEIVYRPPDRERKGSELLFSLSLSAKKIERALLLFFRRACGRASRSPNAKRLLCRLMWKGRELSSPLYGLWLLVRRNTNILKLLSVETFSFRLRIPHLHTHGRDCSTVLATAVTWSLAYPRLSDSRNRKITKKTRSKNGRYLRSVRNCLLSFLAIFSSSALHFFPQYLAAWNRLTWIMCTEV